MFPNLPRAIISSISIHATCFLVRFSSSSSSPSASWLSTPGNPLMRWPLPAAASPPSISPLKSSRLSIPTASSEAPSPPPSGDDGADAVTISHLLQTTDPATLEAALLNSGVAPRATLLEALLRASADHHPAALLALAQWARPHLTPSLLASLVDLLAKSRSFDSAWSLLLDAGGPAPLSAFAALFRRYSRAGMPQSAVRTFHYIRRHPEAVAPPTNGEATAEADPFELLVDALCKEGHTRAATEHIDQTRKAAAPPGWAPSIRCYNMLLHGWFRLRKLRKAERLLEEMRQEGISPTVVTYGTLIEGLCRMRRPEQAASLLDEMRAAGLEANALTCNPIVDAFSEDGRFKEALGMLEKFPLYGVSPNISTYNSLVKGFCKNGDLVGASKILKTMIGRGILPTPTTYNYFFRYFSKFGKVEEGMNLYTKMIESGYAPNRLTYELLIKMLCEKERLDLAVQLIREMIRNGFESDLDTSTMMVHLLCRMHKFDEACAEFEGTIKRGIVPQYITYRMLIKELKRLGMLEMERRLFELMDSIPHSTKLPGTYREREGEEVVHRRKNIMKKAQVISDTLKACNNPKELHKLKSSTEGAVEAANRLMSNIKRRVYAIKSG